MLLRNMPQRSCQALIGTLLWLLPAAGLAREPLPADGWQGESSARQSLGAPQVLEIPPVQDSVPPSVEEPSEATEIAPPVPSSDDPYSTVPQQGPFDGTVPPQEATERRTYLGVMYATAEQGAVGVKVLDVIPGSPAARAGFEGVNKPPSQSNELVRTALIALTMSPVGAFAMPLVIMHDMYMASRTPGDLIVAIGDQQVRDAAEFGQAMQRYRVGDTVVFSVLRHGKPYQLSVQLEEEPL